MKALFIYILPSCALLCVLKSCFSACSCFDYLFSEIKKCNLGIFSFSYGTRKLIGLLYRNDYTAHFVLLFFMGRSTYNDLIYEGVDRALAVPEREIRLFAKPESLVNRRMGVALANADTVDEARKRAVKAASLVLINPA